MQWEALQVARHLRLECEGAIYHVTSRGNERSHRHDAEADRAQSGVAGRGERVLSSSNVSGSVSVSESVSSVACRRFSGNGPAACHRFRYRFRRRPREKIRIEEGQRFRCVCPGVAGRGRFVQDACAGRGAGAPEPRRSQEVGINETPTMRVVAEVGRWIVSS